MNAAAVRPARPGAGDGGQLPADVRDVCVVGRGEARPAPRTQYPVVPRARTPRHAQGRRRTYLPVTSLFDLFDQAVRLRLPAELPRALCTHPAVRRHRVFGRALAPLGSRLRHRHRRWAARGRPSMRLRGLAHLAHRIFTVLGKNNAPAGAFSMAQAWRASPDRRYARSTRCSRRGRRAPRCRVAGRGSDRRSGTCTLCGRRRGRHRRRSGSDRS